MVTRKNFPGSGFSAEENLLSSQRYTAVGTLLSKNKQTNKQTIHLKTIAKIKQVIFVHYVDQARHLWKTSSKHKYTFEIHLIVLVYSRYLLVFLLLEKDKKSTELNI